MRTVREFRSYAKAYSRFPENSMMLLNTRGLKYDLLDQALKYTEENTWATAIDPIITPQTVAAAPRLTE